MRAVQCQRYTFIHIVLSLKFCVYLHFGCLGYIVKAYWWCSVTKLCLTVQHQIQHSRLPCPSLSPGVCSNSCPLSQWCHSTESLELQNTFNKVDDWPKTFKPRSGYNQKIKVSWEKKNVQNVIFLFPCNEQWFNDAVWQRDMSMHPNIFWEFTMSQSELNIFHRLSHASFNSSSMIL